MDSSPISVNELAQACARSANAAEWAEFLRRITPLASLVAARVSRLWMTPPTPELVGDMVQEVYLKLCEHDRRILREFEPRGEDSFLGLLRIVATSVSNDYFRRLRSAKRGGKVVTSQLVAGMTADPFDSSTTSAGIQKDVLLAEFDRMMRSSGNGVSARDRTLFWLYYVRGFTAEEIGAIPSIGLSAKGVESALRRVVLWLRAEIGLPCGEEKPDAASLKIDLPKGALPLNPLNRD